MSTAARNPNSEKSDDKSLRPVIPSAAPGEDSGFEEAKAAGRNFSIVVGGPVYDFFLRIGLVRRGLPNVRARILAFVAIAWLPLLVLSIKDGLALGDRVTIPFLLDFSTYGCLLLALHLLLFAEVVIDPGIRSAVEEFIEEGIVPEKECPAFEQILDRVQRWRDSTTPELSDRCSLLLIHVWTARQVMEMTHEKTSSSPRKAFEQSWPVHQRRYKDCYGGS